MRKGVNGENFLKVKQVLVVLGFFLTFGLFRLSVQAEEYGGGPVRIIYDFIGHYSLNYTGNTNHYDYWNATGTNKLVNRNYKDRTDIPGINNSTAEMNPTDKECKIKAAYLIWQSRSEDAPTTPVGIISPTGAIKMYAADPNRICKDSRFNGDGEEYTVIYTMVAEVTDFVCSNDGGYGTYTVANIPVWEGVQSGETVCGGESVASWQLVVVEESPNFPLRTISLNMLAQYFFNINYRVGVDFADVSAPNGEVSLQWYNLFTDVDSQYRLSGAINWGEEYWEDESNYRYKTQTRGLYKNGICFNNRDSGSLYATGAGTIGAIHGHLYEENRNANNFSSTGIIYLQEGKNRGMCAITLGVAIDVFAYDVVFDGNGADNGSMENMVCVYGRDYNLPNNKYSKQHWNFKGWNTKPDGSGISYKDGRHIKNLTSTEDKVTLYAQWEPDTYKIILDNQYGDFNGTRLFYEWYSFGNYSNSLCTTRIDTIITPDKAGYNFSGYYTEVGGQGTKYIDSDGRILSTSTTFTSDTTLYAYWTPAIYYVTLDSNGGIPGAITYLDIQYGSDWYWSTGAIIPSRANYKFAGFYTEPDGGKMVYDRSGVCVNGTGYWIANKWYYAGDVTLYAHWEPNIYTISLDDQEATKPGNTHYFEKYAEYNYVKFNVADGLTRMVRDFNYSGEVQVFIAPYTGEYKITCVGASGEEVQRIDGYIAKGGKGGATTGSIYLKEGDYVYVYVGGQGGSGIGGFNGGGNGRGPFGYKSTTLLLGAGGGATDIRVNSTSLNNRIMVASGGGGGLVMHGVINNGHEAGRDGYISLNYLGGGLFFTTDDNRVSSGAGRFIKSVFLPSLVSSGTANVGGVAPREDGNTGYIVNTFYKGGFGYGNYGGGGGYYGGGQYTLIHAVLGEIFFSGTAGSNYISNKFINPKIGNIGTVAGSSYSSYYGNGFAKIEYYQSSLYEDKATSIIVPEKNGYIFGGYYTGVNGTGTKYVDASGNILSSPTTFTQNTTLYAYWMRDTIGQDNYKIAFHGNGADVGTMSVMVCEFNQTYSLTANAFSKKGHTFVGWSTTPNGATAFANRARVSNLASGSGSVVTLYAKWESVSGGDVDSQHAKFKINHYIESLTGTWELYSKVTESGISGVQITTSDYRETIAGFTYSYSEVNGTAVYTATILADGGLTVDLYYTRNSYKVTLDKDDANFSVVGEGVYKHGEIVYIDAYISSNYEWSHWSGDFSSTDKEYHFIMPMSDVSMKANTKSVIYTIYLNEQNADESGTLQYYEKYSVGNFADSACTATITNILTPKKEGYTFGGYYTETNGNGTQYIDISGNILSLPTTFTSDTVLYAKWNPISYIVKFDSNGGIGTMPDMICNYGEGYVLTANTYVRNKDKFVGWNTKPDGSGMLYANKAFVSNLCSIQGDSITLYAQWTSNTYTIHFNANGGIGTMDDMVCEFNREYKLDTNQFTREGYGYAGWSLIPDGSLVYTDEAIINNLLMTTGTVNLYAVWIPIYEIILDHQGADDFGTQLYFEKYNIGIYADEACITTITTIIKPKKTGYIFEGYFTEKGGNGTKYVDGDGKILSTPTTFKQDTRLYAYWTPISYVIRFEGNGSTGGSMRDVICSYDESYQLDVNQFSRINYSYLGWNTDRSGNGTFYAEQSMVKNLSSVHGTVVILYAQWKPNTYEVCFDANGGDGTMDSISLFYDTLQKLPENLFVKSNEYGLSTFLGWHPDKMSTSALFEDEEELMNITGCENGSVVLYAVWDDCPWILAEDLYYSLHEACNGLVTYDELMSHAIASDKEDGAFLQPGIDLEKGTAFTIIDYLPTDFTQFTAGGSVTQTYQVVDSVGNRYKKTITVHIVDTTPIEIVPDGTTRFISEKYYDESHENGGLESDSVWKTDPEFVAVIQRTFENIENDEPIMRFLFTYEEILEMKEFIKANGIGNSRNSDALHEFYDKFMDSNMINHQ